MGWVVFFDGDCALCSASVRWVCRADRRGLIAFAPLQGGLSQRLGLTRHAAADGGSLVVLRERDGRIFTRSDGWLEIARALGGRWRLILAARLLPRPLRDGLYAIIARNRHGFSGFAARCDLRAPEFAKRLRE